LNIVFLAPFAYAPKATVSARMLPIAAALVERGHAVHVLIPPYDNRADSGRTWERDGVRFENMRVHIGGPWVYIDLAQQLAARTRELAPDVVHVFKPIGPGALAMQFMLDRQRMPVLVDNDDWEGRGGWIDVNPYPLPMKWFFAWQEEWALRRAAAVTCASHALIERTHSLRGDRPGDVALFANGPARGLRAVVAAARARRAELRAAFGWTDKITAIYAGTIPHGHDMDVLATALPSNVHLSVHATGDGIPSFRAAIERAGKSAQVEWHGFMPHDRLVEYLVAADIAVYPYRDTNINRAKCSGKVMDYMACGLPLVVSDVGMNREYIEHEHSGLLTPPGDAPAFAAAMQRLAADAVLRTRLGDAARARIWKRFGWAERIDALLAVYERHTANSTASSSAGGA
jgi:glycosyltransferase involved in cell wall biosynthesis